MYLEYWPVDDGYCFVYFHKDTRAGKQAWLNEEPEHRLSFTGVSHNHVILANF